MSVAKNLMLQELIGIGIQVAMPHLETDSNQVLEREVEDGHASLKVLLSMCILMSFDCLIFFMTIAYIPL